MAWSAYLPALSPRQSKDVVSDLVNQGNLPSRRKDAWCGLVVLSRNRCRDLPETGLSLAVNPVRLPAVDKLLQDPRTRHPSAHAAEVRQVRANCLNLDMCHPSGPDAVQRKGGPSLSL